MVWLILVAILGLLMFFCYRAWTVWQTRFGNRHEFDADHLAMLMAQREEISGSDDAPGDILATPIANRRNSTGHTLFPKMEKPRPSLATPQAASGGSDIAKKPEVQATRRRQVLDAAAQEVYLRLRADMSSYPVLPAVDVAALVDSDSGLPRMQADFVVCKKDFAPVVAIFLERPDTSLSTLDRVESILKQARLRVLRWPANALPSREEMHAQIFKSRKT